MVRGEARPRRARRCWCCSASPLVLGVIATRLFRWDAD
jgi:hypothetical protein